MIQKPQYAFIDESGNFGFDFESKGVSSYFVLTAVLTDQEVTPIVEKEAEKIRKHHFQTGEMKSSNIKNDQRRFRILEDLSKLNIHIFAVIINKRKLFQDSGLSYKPSFYKFLNSIIYNNLYNSFRRIEIYSDEHGSPEYMQKFKEYVNEKHIPSLFSESDFYFSNSKNSVLIQVADIISGTISKSFEENNLKLFKIIPTLFKEKFIDSKIWPEDYKDYFVDLDKVTDEFDLLITEQAIHLADDYINKYTNSSEIEIQDQVSFLKYLLLNLRFISSDRYVSTHEIIRNISNRRLVNISQHYFRTKVVASLRDDGLLIASGEYGYKLPTSASDIYSFVNHSNSIIIPMINRLNKCRKHLLLVSKNKFDFLNNPEYDELRKLLDK